MVENVGEGSDGMWTEVLSVEVGCAVRACGQIFFDDRGGVCDASKNNITDMLRKLTTAAPLQVKCCDFSQSHLTM